MFFKFADDWIRARVLGCWMQLLSKLSCLVFLVKHLSQLLPTSKRLHCQIVSRNILTFVAFLSNNEIDIFREALLVIQRVLRLRMNMRLWLWWKLWTSLKPLLQVIFPRCCPYCMTFSLRQFLKTCYDHVWSKLHNICHFLNSSQPICFM